MDLTTLTGSPELTVPIGGRVYAFSELPIDALAKLQAFIRANTPNPLDLVKPHLDGLSTADRQHVLEQARLDAKNWPPQVGTSAGAWRCCRASPGRSRPSMSA